VLDGEVVDVRVRGVEVARELVRDLEGLGAVASIVDDSA
jgi:hypothetical protein